MKKCKICNINYNTDRYTCPFCKNLLEETQEKSKTDTIYQQYPKFKDKIRKKSLVHKIFSFLSFVTLLVVFVTNFYEYNKGINSLWSIIALCAITTIWSLVY